MRSGRGIRLWILALIIAVSGTGAVMELHGGASQAGPARHKIAGDALPPVPLMFSQINGQTQSGWWWYGRD